MASGARAERVARRILEELSEIVLFEVTDPRLEGIFITDVKVDRELAYANIYISALEGAEREPEIMQGLNSASGFLRSRLAGRVQLRSFPQLRFNWDPTPEHAEHIDRLLDSLKKDENDDK